MKQHGLPEKPPYKWPEKPSYADNKYTYKNTIPTTKIG